MNIKRPMVLDTSHYNKGIDWSRCADQVAGVYCKATEGYYTLDDEFPSSWKQLLALKIPRAAYHFYRERWLGMFRDPVRQANVFYRYVMVNGGLVAGDRIVLDAEDERMTIQNILACGREMHRLFNQWPLLYTGYYYLKDNTAGYDQLTEGDIADLQQMKLIISCYPTNPDLYSSLPSHYVPDPQIFGPVVGWQYAGDISNHGIPGIPGSLDFNLFENAFLRDWTNGYSPVEPPMPDDPPQPSDDRPLTITHFLYAGAQCHLITADLSVYEVVTDNALNFKTTDRWLTNAGMAAAINGLAGWYVTQLKGRPVVQLDGISYYHGRGVGRFGLTQTLFIDRNGCFSLERPREIWNACSFPNLLIKDGQIQPIRKAATDIRARTAVGLNKDQTRIYLFVCDGGDYWEKKGLNFQDTAQALLSLGCDLAVMSDGGGSTTMVTGDRFGQPCVQGQPCGEEPVVIAGTTYHMRPVAVHFGLRKKVLP